MKPTKVATPPLNDFSPHGPREASNLAAQKPDKFKALHEILVLWRNDTGLRVPRPNPK